ncbi:hypothetical protein Q8O96_30775 [Pseudomonas sp. LPH60]|uniref:hypothetical protein n=1 Tax=Pseudomonas sp. LPH60 TaxID=3065906 RepID=UPI00273B071E|nr:hypothetical protein [Pseudomonas sp. LPH60]MDP4573457.1 hypothetical protein [Pseudomonas sp. LPH60]
MARTKKAQPSELVKLSAELPPLIRALEVEIRQVSECMERLKKDGLIYASEHWRKDSNDDPKYLYLLYSQQQGERRKREYIGCDMSRIEEARAGIGRAKEYDELRAKLTALQSRAYHVQQAMSDARRYLTGEARNYSW